MNTKPYFGLDTGMGNIKLYGEHGGIVFASQAAINGTRRLANIAGLNTAKPPLQIKVAGGSFYVGVNAHNWGRAVENLSYERLSGGPEMRALVYAAFTEYIKLHGTPESAQILVGLPNEVLLNDNDSRAVEQWLTGEHIWQADRTEYRINIRRVKATSQASGALFDHALDLNSKVVSQRSTVLKGEIGICSVGFKTIELLVLQGKTPVPGMTASASKGVRRLMEILNPNKNFTLGELDSMLRSGTLPFKPALPLWADEVWGAIDEIWEQRWRRFDAIVLVGGGATLLKEHLLTRFEGKATIPDEPILAIARGLFKLAPMVK
ncbi:MAG: hypothetical protein OHK0052_20630 [Anaerolineales bacterium]